MTKKLITYTVFYKTFPSKPIWKELKDVELQDDDTVIISYEEGHQSESNSYDGFWFIEVNRQREETDEECAKRIESNKVVKEMLKKNRYKYYLELKKEFEE